MGKENALPLSHLPLMRIYFKYEVPRGQEFELLRAFAHCPLPRPTAGPIPIPPLGKHNIFSRLTLANLMPQTCIHIMLQTHPVTTRTYWPGLEFHRSTSSNGRSGRTRTPDLRFWRPLLFHLSYTPTGALQHSILPPLPKSRQTRGKRGRRSYIGVSPPLPAPGLPRTARPDRVGCLPNRSTHPASGSCHRR